MTEISKSLYYIGTDDPGLDLFENQYPLPHGMSYNSYLLRDERTAIFDTSDHRTAEQWEANLDEALQGTVPDYLIVHHMEPDHSSMIAAMLSRFPSLKVVATQIALKMLPQFFDGIDLEGRTIAVGEGDVLDLGTHKLHFVMAPMVHWPEVMMTYESTERLLFSADGFGTFGTVEHCGGLFCKDIEPWKDEAARYYFNICGKYGAQVRKALDKAAAYDISAICPLHGPVIEDVAGAVASYRLWSSYEPESDGVLVAFASIHGGTEEAARTFARMLGERGAQEVRLVDLCRCDLSAAVANAFRLGRLAVAASSYDAGVFPPMHDFLWHLQIKGWQKRRVAVIENGSWSPTAGRVMSAMLAECKDVEMAGEKFTIRSRMHKEDIPGLEALADALLA